MKVPLFKMTNKTMTLMLPNKRQFSIIFDQSNGAFVATQAILVFAVLEYYDP
ncbi:hypothetical protein [Endozoicomonas sp. SCSIO W0465]|uniref:hypothetical protein n=1 Tax=Endozoicomonas sp. SCSIO W0465 TaxID=2918516 RepID=UPI00207572F0|nr:hypothetical protein [Endozoicomonas sp. SCSIO W0465]USE35586.1 hypothetical protein MJO57_26430 [Endozoicomonas sp. SCSIO W0465]